MKRIYRMEHFPALDNYRAPKDPAPQPGFLYDPALFVHHARLPFRLRVLQRVALQRENHQTAARAGSDRRNHARQGMDTGRGGRAHDEGIVAWQAMTIAVKNLGGARRRIDRGVRGRPAQQSPGVLPGVVAGPEIPERQMGVPIHPVFRETIQEMVKLAADSGCISVFVGMESISDTFPGRNQQGLQPGQKIRRPDQNVSRPRHHGQSGHGVRVR